MISLHGWLSMEMTQMTLLTFLDDVYLVEREIRDSSAKQLRMSVRLFVEQVGTDPEIDDLSHHQFNAWAKANPRKWHPCTMKRRISDVIGVWTYAYSTEETENRPNRLRVRKPRVPRTIPEAWTLEDLESMLASCDTFDQVMSNGIVRGDLLRAVVLVGYHTALRPADLRRLHRSQLLASGKPIPMEKRGGDQVLASTPDYVIDFINSTYGDESRVFAWPYREDYFYRRAWKPMLNAAGLPYDKRQGLQKLRRTAVSHGEAVEEGYGAKLAGHRRGSAVTYQSYVDPRITQTGAVNRLPPLNRKAA